MIPIRQARSQSLNVPGFQAGAGACSCCGDGAAIGGAPETAKVASRKIPSEKVFFINAPPKRVRLRWPYRRWAATIARQRARVNACGCVGFARLYARECNRI